MVFNTIRNNTIERERVIHHHVWWSQAFSEDELDKIESVCDGEVLEEATTVGASSQEFVRKIRRSKVKFFDRNEETGWIFERFNQVAQSLNEQFYNFNLNGYDSFQYTVYDSQDNGTYEWHMDTHLGFLENTEKQHSTRKLTLVMPLNTPGVDYTGGEFQINIGNQNGPLTVNVERGKIIAFPSFIIHRVAPVLTGIRKSIVIWIEGPKFV